MPPRNEPSNWCRTDAKTDVDSDNTTSFAATQDNSGAAREAGVVEAQEWISLLLVLQYRRPGPMRLIIGWGFFCENFQNLAPPTSSLKTN